jgi:hypothetical protein
MRAVLALMASLLALPAHGARPFVTDDARVVDKGHCQIETFYKDAHGEDPSESWLLPACNPSAVPLERGLELTLGGNRVGDERNGILQAKYLIKELPQNGYGLAASAGVIAGEEFVNAIASYAFLDERLVAHANLGRFRELGTAWGLGLEALLIAPRVYGIIEAFGEKGSTPTHHYGIRFWIVPNRFQVDATRGDQTGAPVRRFYTIGLRFIF